MSSVDLEMIVLTVEWKLGVECHADNYRSVSVEQHLFHFEYQCRLKKMGQCRVSGEEPLS